MIRLENVSKYYHTSSTVTCALRKINLEFHRGEFVAITGESGSGKTTLLNIISGLDSYEDGELYINDQPTSYYDEKDWENYRKKEIAFIFQNYNLIESYTVIENVMVPLLISGYSVKEGRKKAKELLSLVGLEADYHKRSSKLSGGQKQRLAIARALANETDIIVADEPTGNLDAENGLAIMKLLKEISVNKLVIVVTHNQPQADSFITRKIRLHDGEIVSDDGNKEIEETISKEIINKDKLAKKPNLINMMFLNIKSQPKRSLLLMLFIFISCLATFIFVGTFITNLDDTKTRKLSDDYFINYDLTRLLVRKSDGSLIDGNTLKDIKVKNIASIEKYDYITDINYFRPGDYDLDVRGGYDDKEVPPALKDTSAVIYNDYSHFMRSSSSLNDSMLAKGTLATGKLEMVIYTKDMSKLNTTETVYFHNHMIWGEGLTLRYEVKIVGILKEPTNQAYFSDDLCKMMDLTQYSNNLTVNALYSYYYRYQVRTYLAYNYIFIDYSLNSNEISFPTVGYNTLGDQLKDYIGTSNYKERLVVMDANNMISVDEYIFNLTKKFDVNFEGLGVSEEIFNSIYNSFKKENQFAVFINDYAYTDDVINALQEEDFKALSCFRASVTGYDTTKTKQRYLTLTISIVSILVINFIEIIVCYTILRFKKNDYNIFKIIGLSNNDSKKINMLELLCYYVISTIILLISIILIKNLVNNQYIVDFFKYIRFYHYIIIVIINLIVIILLGLRFNRFLSKSIKINQLKED